MEKQGFKDFYFRLKSIGSISHYDSQWRRIFEHYNLEWQNWWNDYCEGMHNLVGDFTSDKIRDDTESEFRVGYFSSIFDEEGERLFIKWLYYGKKKDLMPFYEWFEEYMERKKNERELEIIQKKEQKPEVRKKYQGYIYVLKSRNLYKIGRTNDFQSRMKVYQTENPFGVKIIFQKFVNDYIKAEQILLKKFKDKKVRGEWFKLDKDDILWIKQNG